MATASLSRFVTCVAKVEGTYATDPTLAGGTDDVTLIDSSDPIGMNQQVIRVQPHRSSFTHNVKDMAGRTLWDVTLQGVLQGSGSLGAVANGWTGQSALFQSAGFTQTVNAGTSLVLTPSTRSAQKSAYIKLELDGVLHTIAGCYGDLDIFGSVDLGKVRWQYRGTGLYSAPTAASISSVTAPDRAESCLGMTATITPSDGSAYAYADGLYLDGFRYKVNAASAPVDALNASYGVARMLYVDRAPTLELTVVLDTASATLDYVDTYGDVLDSTVTHNISILWGTSPNKFKLLWPTAQLVSVGRPTTKKGYRVQTLSYKVMHATAETESTFTIGNPS